MRGVLPEQVEPLDNTDTVVADGVYGLEVVSGLVTGLVVPGGGLKAVCFKGIGTLIVASGLTRWTNDIGAEEIVAVRFDLDVASSSGTVTADVNLNGTTIFTTQANRPTLAAGSRFGSKITNHDVTAIADGDYLTWDCDGAGTGAAGPLMTVLLR